MPDFLRAQFGVGTGPLNTVIASFAGRKEGARTRAPMVTACFRDPEAIVTGGADVAAAENVDTSGVTKRRRRRDARKEGHMAGERARVTERVHGQEAEETAARKAPAPAPVSIPQAAVEELEEKQDMQATTRSQPEGNATLAQDGAGTRTGTVFSSDVNWGTQHAPNQAQLPDASERQLSGGHIKRGENTEVDGGEEVHGRTREGMRDNFGRLNLGAYLRERGRNFAAETEERAALTSTRTAQIDSASLGKVGAEDGVQDAAQANASLRVMIRLEGSSTGAMESGVGAGPTIPGGTLGPDCPAPADESPTEAEDGVDAARLAKRAAHERLWGVHVSEEDKTKWYTGPLEKMPATDISWKLSEEEERDYVAWALDPVRRGRCLPTEYLIWRLDRKEAAISTNPGQDRACLLYTSPSPRD